jgi:hypothetical protein
MGPVVPARHAWVGASQAPPEADSERAREHRLELLVRVYDVAPSDAEVRYRPASKSVGPTPHQAHAGESETASGPAAYLSPKGHHERATHLLRARAGCGGGPLLWTLALPPPSPLEGVSQHRAHVPALLAHPRPTATDQPDGQYELDRDDAKQGDVRHSAGALLDHLIRPLQERRRDRQAEGLRGLEVDDQLKLGRLLDGEVAGLRAF